MIAVAEIAAFRRPTRSVGQVDRVAVRPDQSQLQGEFAEQRRPPAPIAQIEMLRIPLIGLAQQQQRPVDTFEGANRVHLEQAGKIRRLLDRGVHGLAALYFQFDDNAEPAGHDHDKAEQRGRQQRRAQPSR
jgi:hypothetical protein